MATRPTVIERFRDLPGTVEVVSFGAVRQPGGEAQEVEVEVVVASDLGAPGFDPDADVRVLWMGSGQLDVLVPGSLWRGGGRIGEGPSRRVVAMFGPVKPERLKEGVRQQADGGRPFPSRASATAPCMLLRRINEAEAKGQDRKVGPQLVLLPWIELLRSLFGVSNGSLLELFDGIRDPAVSGERGVVDRRLSRFGDDGTVRLVTARDLSRDEAIIAAAIVADRRMRSLHDGVFQHLSVRSEWKDGLPVHMNVAWPWREALPIDLEGRWVERVDGTRRFVVSRIAAIGVPLPFERVEVHHAGTEGGRREDLPPPSGRVRGANARVVVLTVRRAASPSRRPVEVPTASVLLSTAAEIEVVHEPRGGRGRDDRGTIGEEPRDGAPFGTGGRQPGADPKVGAAVTKRRARKGEVPARTRFDALDATWKALKSACVGEGWSLDALPRSGAARRDASHGGLDLRPEPLVAMVSTGAGRLLVVDRGSALGDECSLGLLVPASSGSSDRALAVAARTACESVDGRWRSARSKDPDFAPDFVVKATARDVEVWEDPAAYADLLRRRIASALRPPRT